MTSSSSEPKSRLGEFALIKKLFAPLSKGARGAFDLSDDAAALHLAEDRELVVTVDTVIEGVHFLKDDPADLIARKATGNEVPGPDELGPVHTIFASANVPKAAPI